MAKFNTQWKVGPHGPLETIDDRLLTVASEIRMPLGNFPRRMTVIGLPRDRSAIWSPIPLRDPEMRAIERLGEPAFLIVPGIGHRLDIRPWHQRYPKAKILCTPGARAAVSEVVEVDATTDIIGDPAVSLESPPGVGGKEAALKVRRSDGTTLLLNDLLANVRHPNGLGAHIMARLMGFGVSRPKMPWVGKRMFVEDGKALAAAFRAWAAIPDLVRIVVSHGDVITDRPAEILERIAGELDR